MYQRSGRIDAPAAGEYVHRQHRKADARKAEGRRADDAGQAEPEGEVADEKLEQRSERQIGDDQQCRGGPDQDRIAAERDLEQAMDDAEARSHHDEEDAEIGCELADKGQERAAAGGRQPLAHAACPEFRADSITCGDGDDDVKHRGQDRAQQELGVVQRRVGEHILLDDERTGGERRSRRRGRQLGDRRRDRSLKRARCDIARREELLVEEDDDLRPAAIEQVALEVLRECKRRRGPCRNGRHASRC